MPALTSIKCKNAPPKERAYKLFDEKGLYLFIRPNGAKSWRLKYRFDGKEKTLFLGVFPEVALKEARDKRDDARGLLREGIDPGKKLKKPTKDLFKAVMYRQLKQAACPRTPQGSSLDQRPVLKGRMTSAHANTQRHLGCLHTYTLLKTFFNV